MHDISVVQLDSAELEEINALVSVFSDVDDPVSAVRELVPGLPTRLLDALDAFRRGEGGAGLRLGVGRPGRDTNVATPAHWRESHVFMRAWDVPLLLVAAALGEPFAWQTQQGGRLVTDVIPIRESQSEQTGHGSLVDFDLHSEDAFTEYRCDCVALTCVRNANAVPTLVSSVSALNLSPADFEVLSQSRFTIAIDTEHLRNIDGENPDSGIDSVQSGGMVALLSGAATDWRLRIDCAEYVAAATGDGEAGDALGRLFAELHKNAVPISLDVGDILLIDNARAAHGRPSYRANYDGGDRWLRRVMVAYPDSLCGHIVASTRQRVITLF